MSFIVGAPVRNTIPLPGRQHQLATIARRLCSARNSISIVAERRTGKTSMLLALASQWAGRKYGLDQEGLILTYMDCQMFGPDISPAQFWERAVRQIIARASVIGDDILLPANMPQDIYSVYDFLGNLTYAGRTPVLLLDEFDCLNLDGLGAGFFANLRSLASSDRLCLITASATELPELLQGREAGHGSPLWDIFFPMHLPLFELEDCQECVAVCTEGTDCRFTPDEILDLAAISGGHPFLLQLAGEGLYQAYMLGLSDHERMSYAREHSKVSMEQMFQLYWTESPDSHKIVLASFALLEIDPRRARSSEEEEIRRLCGAPGFVFAELQRRSLLRKSAAGKYELLCPALASWIAAELTAPKSDVMNYESWLAADRAGARLSKTAKKELRSVLPRIAGNYRELVIAWASDPEHLVRVVALLRSALGLG